MLAAKPAGRMGRGLFLAPFFSPALGCGSPTFARDKSVLEVKIVDYGQNGNGILLNRVYKISTFKQMQHNLPGCSLRCFVTFKNVSIPYIEIICLFYSFNILTAIRRPNAAILLIFLRVTVIFPNMIEYAKTKTKVITLAQ